MTPVELEARIQRVLDALGRPRDPATASLCAWAALVAEWNDKIDLTAARHPDELIDLLIADAAVLAQRTPRGGQVVDVGSGAGAPGLPLGLLRPDLEVTLVEPLQKRVAFLRTVLGTLGASDGARIRVERVRGEELARRGRHFDVAISRATLPPPAWLELGAKLGDLIWVLLARDEPPAREGIAIVADVRYSWPLTGAPRRAVGYARPSSP